MAKLPVVQNMEEISMGQQRAMATSRSGMNGVAIIPSEKCKKKKKNGDQTQLVTDIRTNCLILTAERKERTGARKVESASVFLSEYTVFFGRRNSDEVIKGSRGGSGCLLCARVWGQWIDISPCWIRIVNDKN